MRAVFLLVLVIGMALAGAAVYMIQKQMALTENLLAEERAFNAKAGKLVEVYVFAAELQYGDALKEEDVQLIYWPEATLPKSIFRDKAILFPVNAPGPRYVMRATEAFEPVLASRLTEPGELAGLTAKPGWLARRSRFCTGATICSQPGHSAVLRPRRPSTGCLSCNRRLAVAGPGASCPACPAAAHWRGPDRRCARA